MKKLTTASIYIFLILALDSCNIDTIKVSDIVTTEQVSFKNYSALSISDDFNAYVTFSDTEEKIEIEANRNLHERIVVRKEGTKLHIKMENNLIIKGNETLNIYIITKQINNFECHGDSRLILESSLDTQSAKVALYGDSYFSGELYLDDLKLILRGDSKADIYGKVNLLGAELSGGSTLKDYDLEIDNLIIDLRGDSNAYLSVKSTIDVDASGDSVLRYKGNAAITHQRLNGDSKVLKKD
tara:strand:+ start:6719 stop:7441 length:723 start_codon:yes stop_codon:yes gene_type:complete